MESRSVVDYMTREQALGWAAQLIYTGHPISPSEHRVLKAKIGLTTEAEEAQLSSARRAHDAAMDRQRRDYAKLNEACEKLRQVLRHA